jgi:hypothetical protein
LQEQLQFVTGTRGPPASAKRQAILVLGMHRSGTSAVGGVINALGAAGPKNLLAPRPDNPRGFFESAILADAHDALLAAGNSWWEDWRQFDSRISPETTDRHRERIKSVLTDEFGEARLIFIKDPRICRFVPVTLSVLAELNISPVAILPMRNPLEVACSLKTRNGFALSRSILLWLRHVLDAEYHSRQLPRYFLPYQEFLIDWRSCMNRAAEKMGINWPALSDASAQEIDKFLTVDLYHERASLEDVHNHPTMTSLARATYDVLRAIAADGESEGLLRELDQIRNKFDEDCEMVGDVVGAEFEVRRLRKKIEALSEGAERFERKKFGFTPPFAEVPTSAFHHGRFAAMHNSQDKKPRSRTMARDNLATVHDSLIDAREITRASEAHRLKIEQDSLAAAALQDRLAKRDRIASAREGQLVSDVHCLTVERDSLTHLLATCKSELENLRVERDSVANLVVTRESEARQERELLLASLNTLVAERDSLAAACNSLELAHAAVLSSRSWRLTAPLRFLRGLF